MTGQTGPPLRPASSFTRLVPQRPRVVPREGSGLAFRIRRKRSLRTPRTARPPEGRAPLGQVSELPAPLLGMACPFYLLPILSPPPPPLEAHARIPDRPPTLLLSASSPLLPPPLPGAPRGPPHYLPGPLIFPAPSPAISAGFQLCGLYQMPSLHLRPLICWAPRPHALLFFPLLDGDLG